MKRRSTKRIKSNGKNFSNANQSSKATKRESEEANAPPAKKARTEENKTSSLSNLLKTVNANETDSTKPLEEDKAGAKKAKPKKPGLRVKWSDHFGGSLSLSGDATISVTPRTKKCRELGHSI